MRPILSAILALALPGLAQAADIRLSEDPRHGCLITLDGQIAPGDTDKLLAQIKRADTESRHADLIWYTEYPDGPPDIDFKVPVNLCLDSPGGNLAEAIRLTQQVHGRLGTMIRPGARCESACAMVFMAGSYNTGSDIGIVANRHLHVEGRLGFHAPSLTVPEATYDAETVARAYQVSVQATALIFRNLVKFRFAPSLAARMHETPPEDMFHVSTVREAARWDISVVGIDAPDSFSDDVIRTACSNLYLATMDRLSSSPDVWHGGGMAGQPVTRRGDGSFSFEGFGMEALGHCEGRLLDMNDDYTPVDMYWGQSRVARESVWASGAFPDAEPPLFFAFFQNYMAYPGDMPLATLPRAGRTQTLERSGTCFVYNRDGQLTDRDPCRQERRVDTDGTLVEVHHWPSGARTLIETAGLEPRINGQPTQMGFWPDPRPDDAPYVCPQNRASGNTFCFHPD